MYLIIAMFLKRPSLEMTNAWFLMEILCIYGYLWMKIYFFPCIIYIPIYIQFIWNILVGINFYSLVVDS